MKNLGRVFDYYKDPNPPGFFFNFPSTFYDQIGKTRAAMGRAAIIAHSFIIILYARSY
jgi:hypothetical protein